MNVHEAITKHTQKQNAHLEQFLRMEEARERAIDQAVADCSAGRSFSVDEINAWTKKINEHAHHGISPTRVLVTPEMIEQYVKRSK